MNFVIQEVEADGSKVKAPSRPNHRDDTGAWQRIDSTIDICEQNGLFCQAVYGPNSQPKQNFIRLQDGGAEL